MKNIEPTHVDLELNKKFKSLKNDSTSYHESFDISAGNQFERVVKKFNVRSSTMRGKLKQKKSPRHN